MSAPSNEITQWADWMRLQAACLSRSENDRARFAMTAEWLSAWAALEVVHDDPSIRQFIADCLHNIGADDRALLPSTATAARVLH